MSTVNSYILYQSYSVNPVMNRKLFLKAPQENKFSRIRGRMENPRKSKELPMAMTRILGSDTKVQKKLIISEDQQVGSEETMQFISTKEEKENCMFCENPVCLEYTRKFCYGREQESEQK
ncbi:hypothetical protein AVEN_220435-1 [Araneus ventricosus]|uniref:Uncharacterized protein n=1 Tax=Araneus ventricosus TaxID=182803 RepID=A0A4Y2ISJ3_ARAVE|nr:hypothetical protein AVEN_220435-1 [Araneus ventricosus]